jgi:hypothetical protein
MVVLFMKEIFNLIKMFYYSLLIQFLISLFKIRKVYFKYTFFKLYKFVFKPYFKYNIFIQINQILWPLRFSLNETFWTKILWYVRESIKGFFLRKNKSFYKGRYARNRQTCRVIVFWTIALNLVLLYGLYFFFYQFLFNFGYFWWGLFLLFFSLHWSCYLKYRFYNFLNLILEFFYFLKWFISFFNFIPREIV